MVLPPPTLQSASKLSVCCLEPYAIDERLLDRRRLLRQSRLTHALFVAGKVVRSASGVSSLRSDIRRSGSRAIVADCDADRVDAARQGCARDDAAPMPNIRTLRCWNIR
jgi:hypothetical protein